MEQQETKFCPESKLFSTFSSLFSMHQSFLHAVVFSRLMAVPCRPFHIISCFQQQAVSGRFFRQAVFLFLHTVSGRLFSLQTSSEGKYEADSHETISCVSRCVTSGRMFPNVSGAADSFPSRRWTNVSYLEDMRILGEGGGGGGQADVSHFILQT